MRCRIQRVVFSEAFSIRRKHVSISNPRLGGVFRRKLHIAPRQHRTNFWIPQATFLQSQDALVDAGQLLIRAGYIRQAYSGIFHMLPLGLRVQSKIEALVDKHMQSLQASKVSLSSISSQKLWSKSGRLNTGSEFFKFRDRKGAPWLLAPTHEEEITTLAKEVTHAPGHLPLRLYQISRKYRDEKRPRGGLLRGREFIMKDLYTFDATESDAHATYNDVRKAYNNLFAELKLPYIEAQADSGDMGGSLSHEFHFPSNIGEDNIITCSNCDFAKNEEFVPPFETVVTQLKTSDLVHDSSTKPRHTRYEQFISKDRNTLVKAFIEEGESSHPASINPFVVKKSLSEQTDVDTGVENAEALFALALEMRASGTTTSAFDRLLSKTPGYDGGDIESIQDLFASGAISKEQPKVYYLFDQSTNHNEALLQTAMDSVWLEQNEIQPFVARINDASVQHSHLLKKRNGDPCPACASNNQEGRLKVEKAIEVGHTFHLGERYSSKLGLQVPTRGVKDANHGSAFVSMGCHGIGVSRLIAAVASALSDSKGLVWPRAVAPFEVLVIVNTKIEGYEETVAIGNQIYDNLSKHTDYPADVLIDDRANFDFGWKMRDADMIGYPVVVVIGKGWMKEKLVEIQCRRLETREQIPLETAPERVRELLKQL